MVSAVAKAMADKLLCGPNHRGVKPLLQFQTDPLPLSRRPMSEVARRFVRLIREPQTNKNPPRVAAGLGWKKRRTGASYFCHVRFLWRFDFKRFRRLCLFIFKRRFFFRLPICRRVKRACRPSRCPARI
jgi:hypothetical protein